MRPRNTAGVPRLILAFCLVAATASVAPAQSPIAGTVTRVQDGDTLCVGSIAVRLEGIDAPERREYCRRETGRWRCGPRAAKALRDMALNRTLTCQPKYCDPHGRTVAVCRLNGSDLAEAMVAAGWAVDWPYYSGARYGKAQNAARTAGRGVWVDGGGPTRRMRSRMRRPGTRRKRGPWPPCKTRCDLPPAEALAN